MRKSKRNLYDDRPPSNFIPLLLGAGMLLLCFISCMGVMRWNMHRADLDYARTGTPLGVQRFIYVGTPVPVLGKVVSISDQSRPLKGNLIFTASDGVLYRFSAPHTLANPTVTLIPDLQGWGLSVFGQRLAGVCPNGEVCVRLDNDAPLHSLKVQGTILAWGADGETVYYYTHTEGTHTLHRATIQNDSTWDMITLKGLSLPILPIFDPATGRILIADWDKQKGTTTLFTIPADCVGDSQCRSQKQVISTLAHAITSADYHPSAMYLAYSDFTGAIYLMNTRDGSTQFVVGGTDPTFSPDGAQLAFLNGSNMIQLMDLSDMTVIDLGIPALSVAWME